MVDPEVFGIMKELIPLNESLLHKQNKVAKRNGDVMECSRTNGK